MERRASNPHAQELYGNTALQLPFKGASKSDRRLHGTGLCIQGNNGVSTHTGTLKYAVDFKLPVGTPILAVRGGTVAAAASHFKKGGLDSKLRPRANFVSVQHSDGSYARYFHLRHNGVLVARGDTVAAGDQIGLSGNTGFSSTPHLHFDVVDVLPEDTCCLNIRGVEEISAVSAAFSSRLLEDPMEYRIILADPPDASSELKNGDEVKGNAVFISRGGCSFTTKVKNALAAEVSCIIVSNNQHGPELFSMGGTDKPLLIPAVLISKESGAQIRRLLTETSEIFATLRSSPGYQLSQSKMEDTETTDEGKLHYVANTLPVEFHNGNASFIPQEGVIYPVIGDSDMTPNRHGCCTLS